MEQIRIIKEMREADAGGGSTGQFLRPRFMVWEQVPGAFSSNKGEDFRRVLEETIRIAEPDAPDVPLPPKGKWPLADCWMGDGWSVAYRVLDAQFWGVPQRRRRIALVADFGGHAAPEILFVRKGVCGDSPESGAPGEETAAGTGSGADCAVTAVHLTQDPITGHYVSPCLSAGNPKYGQASIGVFKGRTDYLTGWDNQEKRVFSTKGVSPTLSGSDGGGGRTVCGYIYDARGNGDGKTACTLTVDHQSRVTDYTAIVMRQKSFGDYRQGIGTLTSGTGHEYTEHLVVDGQVRRLTPLECERLQGLC